MRVYMLILKNTHIYASIYNICDLREDLAKGDDLYIFNFG